MKMLCGLRRKPSRALDSICSDCSLAKQPSDSEFGFPGNLEGILLPMDLAWRGGLRGLESRVRSGGPGVWCVGPGAQLHTRTTTLSFCSGLASLKPIVSPVVRGRVCVETCGTAGEGREGRTAARRACGKVVREPHHPPSHVPSPTFHFEQSILGKSCDVGNTYASAPQSGS